jgi:hypothetical protein
MNTFSQPYERQVGARTNKNTAKWTEGFEEFSATRSGVLDSRERNGFAKRHSFNWMQSAQVEGIPARSKSSPPSCRAKLNKGRVETGILVEFASNRPLRHFVWHFKKQMPRQTLATQNKGA